MICVPDLRPAVDAYTRIGFDVHAGGVHPGGGTENAIAFFQDDYLELLAIRKGEERLAGAALTEFLARGPGMRYVAVQSDDLAADVAAMRRRGVDVGDPTDGGRRTPAGGRLRWRGGPPGPAEGPPVFFLQHRTPPAGRPPRRPGGPPHPAPRTPRAHHTAAPV